MRIFLLALIGLIAGGVVGMLVFFGAGLVMVETFKISCFEGACGYVVVAMGLLGAIVGGLAGAIWLGVRAARR